MKSALYLLILGEVEDREDFVETKLIRVEVRAFPTRPSP